MARYCICFILGFSGSQGILATLDKNWEKSVAFLLVAILCAGILLFFGKEEK